MEPATCTGVSLAWEDFFYVLFRRFLFCQHICLTAAFSYQCLNGSLEPPARYISEESLQPAQEAPIKLPSHPSMPSLTAAAVSVQGGHMLFTVVFSFHHPSTPASFLSPGRCKGPFGQAMAAAHNFRPTSVSFFSN